MVKLGLGLDDDTDNTSNDTNLDDNNLEEKSNSIQLTEKGTDTMIPPSGTINQILLIV